LFGPKGLQRRYKLEEQDDGEPDKAERGDCKRHVARSGDFAGAGVGVLFSFVAFLCAVRWWLMLSRSIKHLHFQEQLIRTLEVDLKLPLKVCVSRNLNPEIDRWLRGPRARPLMIAFVTAPAIAWLIELVISGRHWLGV
jgi:hypothetical protein